MITNYRLLLKQAAMIYEKHEAGRKEPFNVFTVLRKASDEVNLHSRFLHALLDHQSPDTGRQNLKDFLRKICVKKFELDGVTVRREYKNIDILISNDATKQHPVVIENKIYAEDGPAQLQTYYDTLKKEKYSDIHLLYLTLDGHDPSKDSVGNLPYQTISYRDDLLPWLKCCQMYACEEPELRESIVQYIHLIRKLTDTDFEEAYRNELKELFLSEFSSLFRADVCQDGAYMNKLKDLLFEGNNFVLAHDLTKNISEDNNPGLAHLNEAVTRRKISLLWKLWCEIESALKNIKAQISSFPDKDADLSNISKEKVAKYVRKKMRHNLLLYYRVSAQVHLGVQLDRGVSYYNIYFGILCDRTKCPTKYSELQNALKALNGRSTGKFPWYKYADEELNFNTSDRKTLNLLSNEKKREKLAKGIADGLKEVWKEIRQAELTGRQA